jgi:three-Cys-motif partner protein
MAILWALESHTEAKHRLYKRYLDAWWPILLQQHWVNRVTFVDAFAGPGEYRDGEEGSPVFTLDRLLHHEARKRMNLSRDRVTLIFIENDGQRKEHLHRLLVERFGPLDQLPVTVIVECGRAEKDTMRLLDETRAWGQPILAIFDSWGNVAVPWEQLRRIANNKASEYVVTFGPNWFSRRENQEPDKLDLIFGGSEYWQPSTDDLTSRDRWREWLETYHDAIRRAGHQFALTFQVMPRTGQPLYLVYGTSSVAGVNAFKDAMWKVDTSDGMRFDDPRTTAGKQAAMAALQPTLFEDPDAPDPELLGFVDDAVRQRGHATVGEVAEFLLRETARWRQTHARPAIQYLIGEGRLVRQPTAGQLRADTVLRPKD